jgi:hypothetical protein
MQLPTGSIAWMVVTASLFLFAAWFVLRSPVPWIDAATADRLAAITDKWCERGSIGKVPPDQWPAEVRRVRPRSVRLTADGLSIELGSRFVESWGLFILRSDSPFQATRTTDPSYRLLQGRVYWYEVKG